MKSREVSWIGPEETETSLYRKLNRKLDAAIAVSYVAIGMVIVLAIWVTYLLTESGFIQPRI